MYKVEDIIRGLKTAESIDIYIAGIEYKTYDIEERRVFRHDREMCYSYCRILKPTKVRITKTERKPKRSLCSWEKANYQIDIHTINLATEETNKKRIPFKPEYRFFDSMTEAENYLSGRAKNKAVRDFENSLRNTPRGGMIYNIYSGKVAGFLEKLAEI